MYVLSESVRESRNQTSETELSIPKPLVGRVDGRPNISPG